MLSAMLQDGHHAVLGSQSDAGLQRDLLSFLEPQAKSLGEYRKNQYRFGHGEGRADANPRSAAEGQV